MNKSNVMPFVLVSVVAAIGLWVARDQISQYSGVVMAWLTLTLVFVTAMYVREVGEQVEFARETVLEAKKQRESFHQPLIVVSSKSYGATGKGLKDAEFGLFNRATATALNVRCWADHPLARPKNATFRAEVGPSGEGRFTFRPRREQHCADW
ncbi:MAG: hypothetical protein ACTSYX_03355 [Candidatus Thorarchaeota archaeon]